MSFPIQIIYAKLNNMAGRQTKKEVSGKFCTETWKASSLAALPWIANSCYSLKLANAEAQGLFGFVFFPGYSQCCASGKLTGNTTSLLPLFSLAEPHTVVKSMHRTPRGIAMQAGHKRNTHTAQSHRAGARLVSLPTDRVTPTLHPEQGTPAPCACQSPPTAALNCLQPEQELP